MINPNDAATADDAEDFRLYCEWLTDAQVEAVIEKETTAGRIAYADIARAEKRARARCQSHR